MSGDQVLPVDCPSRATLWRRLQLVNALLGHRPMPEDTKEALSQAVSGVYDEPGGRRDE